MEQSTRKGSSGADKAKVYGGTVLKIALCAALLGPATTLYSSNNEPQIDGSTHQFIAALEGKKNTPYRDANGHWTIGIGHQIQRNERHLLKAKLTDSDVFHLFRLDLNRCEQAVKKSVKVELNQHQTDAIYSLCFNIGEHRFSTSSVVKKLNAKDYTGAAKAFLLWNKPAVLLGRRKEEKQRFEGKNV